MPKNDVYVAKESFACRLDGKRVIVNRGKTRVRHGHPLMEGREHLFSPIGVQFDVEQATQAPGEVRGGRQACDVEGCGTIAKSAAGLAAHKRSHDA